MKTNEILELVRAGYTKAEIEAFDNDKNAETKPKTATEPPAKTATEPPAKTATEPPAKTDNVNDDIKALSATVAELTNTIKEMQSNNVKKADAGAPKTETAESAIRDFFGVKEGK